MEDTPDP
jgi:hypothetical protein